MTVTGFSRAGWRTSSYSGGNGSCVQVSCPVPYSVAVRDSADPGGPGLAFTAAQWHRFAEAVRHGTALP